MTIDYAWPADSAIRCQCGSENCRGWIVASDMDEALRESGAVSAKPQAAEGGTAIYAASPERLPVCELRVPASDQCPGRERKSFAWRAANLAALR